MPDVARYEPHVALFAAGDGLDIIRRLVPMTGGASFIALEMARLPGDAVEALLRENGFTQIERRHDLSGIERVVVGARG